MHGALVWVPAPSEERKGLVHFTSLTCSSHPTGTLDILLMRSATYKLHNIMKKHMATIVDNAEQALDAVDAKCTRPFLSCEGAGTQTMYALHDFRHQ